MSFPARPAALGIDIVDLDDPRTRGKGSDDRFLGRICADDEITRIRNHADPDLALWMHWAAKEAVFKSETCSQGVPPVFDHSEFVFTPSSSEAYLAAERDGRSVGWNAQLSGVVIRGDAEQPVLISLRGAVMALTIWRDKEEPIAPAEGLALDVEVGVLPTHAAAAALGIPGDLDALRADPALYPEALRSHSYESAVVRLAARSQLARSLDEPLPRVRIVTPPGPTGRTPPHVEVGGELHPGIDVSITHHGGLVAWVTRAGLS